MRKVVICGLITVLLMVVCANGAYAKVPETATIESLIISPSLSYDGSIANCGVVVRADKSSDSIYVTMKLWQGNFLLATWNASGTGNVSMSKQKSVAYGATYKVTVDVSINGVAQSTKSISKYH